MRASNRFDIRRPAIRRWLLPISRETSFAWDVKHSTTRTSTIQRSAPPVLLTGFRRLLDRRQIRRYQPGGCDRRLLPLHPAFQLRHARRRHALRRQRALAMRRYVERSLWCYRLEVCTEVGCLHRRLLVGIQWRIVEQLFRERQRRYYGGIALQVLKSRGRHDLSPLSSPRKRGPITPASGILVSFLLAMFGHAGPVGVDLLVAPEVLRITRRPNAALVQGLRPLRADSDAAVVLRVARRCQRGHGERQRKRSQTFLQVSHDESASFFCRPVT